MCIRDSIGPVDKLAALAEQYGAIMMVDDAHSSGVLGRNGRGTIDHFGLDGRVHIQVGTLSKAIGVLGGYVCGSRDLIEFLYHRARPFLFSTSHPPAVAAACIAAFDVLEQEPERMESLWTNTRYFKKGLASAGFNTGIKMCIRDSSRCPTLPFTWTLSCTKSPTHFPFKRWYSRILRSGYQPECRIHRPR